MEESQQFDTDVALVRCHPKFVPMSPHPDVAWRGKIPMSHSSEGHWVQYTFIKKPNIQCYKIHVMKYIIKHGIKHIGRDTLKTRWRSQRPTFCDIVGPRTIVTVVVPQYSCIWDNGRLQQSLVSWENQVGRKQRKTKQSTNTFPDRRILCSIIRRRSLNSVKIHRVFSTHTYLWWLFCLSVSLSVRLSLRKAYLTNEATDWSNQWLIWKLIDRSWSWQIIRDFRSIVRSQWSIFWFPCMSFISATTKRTRMIYELIESLCPLVYLMSQVWLISMHSWLAIIDFYRYCQVFVRLQRKLAYGGFRWCWSRMCQVLSELSIDWSEIDR